MVAKRTKGKKERKGVSHIGPHHIVPSSRGGPSLPWNMYAWVSQEERSRKHPAWHTLAANKRYTGNMLPSEVIERIHTEWTRQDGGLKVSELTQKQRDAWRIFFGGEVTPQEAIAWIEAHFLPAEMTWKKKGTPKPSLTRPKQPGKGGGGKDG